MHALFRPRSIAIAGASQTEGKLGNLIVRRIAADFRGRIFPINPRAREIAGLAAYDEIAALPQEVDLLIALLPGPGLLPLIESCRPGQVRYLLAIPSGFGEVSDAGRALQGRIVAAARDRDIRVVGPNCMGLLNGAIALNASLAPEMPPIGGGFSFLTQSGGMGIAATMYAIDHRLPVSIICDLGNTADIQAHEVMAHLRDDPDTGVVGILLESAGDGDSFITALADLAAVKPTVVTLLGRTGPGQRASQAHLGLVADPGLLEQIADTGAMTARTGRELFNLAKSLSWQPRAAGPRAAIMTGTGGVGSELADLAVEAGLAVPELPASTVQVLRRHLPDYAGFANPIDLTPIWWQYPEVYPPVLEALLDADCVDLAVVGITDVATGIDNLATALVDLQARRRERGGAAKPVYVYWGARDDKLANMRVLEEAGIPCYRSTWETIAAIGVYARGGAAPGRGPRA